MTRIKICGLRCEQDISFVNEARPDYAGFIVNFPRSRRNLSPERFRGLTAGSGGAAGLDPGIARVAVVVDQPVSFAAELLAGGAADIIQLHGHEDERYIGQLRELLDKDRDIRGSERIWKAFRIRGRDDLEKAFSSSADRVILDNGWGTGEVFDWSLLEKRRAGKNDGEFILAGGLDPGNLAEAIKTMTPWGVDISSGVETENAKDRDKILAAVEICRRDSVG